MPTLLSHFPAAEKAALLALKGVGPTVLLRLEQLGIHSLAQLAEEDASVLTQRVAQLLGSSCWRNSPQARAASCASASTPRAMPLTIPIPSFASPLAKYSAISFP